MPRAPRGSRPCRTPAAERRLEHAGAVADEHDLVAWHSGRNARRLPAAQRRTGDVRVEEHGDPIGRHAWRGGRRRSGNDVAERRLGIDSHASSLTSVTSRTSVGCARGTRATRADEAHVAMSSSCTARRSPAGRRCAACAGPDRASGRWHVRSGLEVAAERLFALDGLEQRLEVALANRGCPCAG